jgi:hypothetical protein
MDPFKISMFGRCVMDVKNGFFFFCVSVVSVSFSKILALSSILRIFIYFIFNLKGSFCW